MKFLRQVLANTYGKDIAEKMSILYGGSVNPSNAGAYLTIPGVNGLIMSNASLVADQFVEIVEIAKRVQS